MIDYSKRAYVYWNLRRKVWSVAQSGLVVDHAGSLSLRDCKFLVGTKGRDRVRREGKKNVHAGVSGYLYKDSTTVDRMARNDMYEWDQIWVMYNPYKHDTFIQRTGVCDDKYPRPVYAAEFVFMDTEIELGVPRVMALEPKHERAEA